MFLVSFKSFRFLKIAIQCESVPLSRVALIQMPVQIFQVLTAEKEKSINALKLSTYER